MVETDADTVEGWYKIDDMWELFAGHHTGHTTDLHVEYVHVKNRENYPNWFVVDHYNPLGTCFLTETLSVKDLDILDDYREVDYNPYSP